MWQAAIKNLDVPQVRLHDARHTCATLIPTLACQCIFSERSPATAP
jgi:hypothetical protein